MAPSLRGLSVSKNHVIASQCAHWRGNPYPLQGGALRVPSAHRRPLGDVSLYERQRERIATPACGLVRDDIYILGFSTVCSPLREGAKASFSAFHNFKFLIRIKEEGFFEISVTYSSFSASIFQKQTTERRISYESHVSLCGLFRVGDAAVFVPVCQRPAGMKFFRNPVTFFHRDASIL